ncbi:hypothetical protein PAXRUDRAFT_268627 [Paxillus rubicundulus Ve08.2h10]|uniref:Uncharacterized protein n=1 Tax=Paxillus rubicundulus Ve08.2h10 TaxID=930991 RepID=A0A0D0EAX1_9AGAM|nr:hypothetical protein PAXRUDRAFT_268627 [Paxillus rubicundulus Ve08.2h10]
MLASPFLPPAVSGTRDSRHPDLKAQRGLLLIIICRIYYIHLKCTSGMWRSANSPIKYGACICKVVECCCTALCKSPIG